MKYLTAALFVVIIVAGAFYAGRSVTKLDRGVAEDGDAQLSKNLDSSLINPTVTLNIGKHFILNLKPLREELNAIRALYPQKTYVYFVYLNNDTWIGLDERDYFTAASTVKVPLAMAVLKAVENGSFTLDTEYMLREEDLDERFGDFHKTGAGSSHTVNELIEVMLRESDNTAMNALVALLHESGIDDPFSDVYNAMGWDKPTGFGNTPSYFDINLKTLSTMFIALYNAKYVNIEHSQLILRYLDQSQFNEQIVAGVPKNIAVAHKQGVAEEGDIYSDCGIVYVPSRNYLLCIGSVGASKPQADSFMVDISKAAYEYVIAN